MDLFFDLVSPNELQRAHELEVEGFPPDEAASLETFQYRQKIAPSLFLGGYFSSPTARELIGYICATRTTSNNLTHESMSCHESSGKSLAIHAVCVSTSHRGKGIAKRLLEEYSRRMAGDASITQILLICHNELIKWYELSGFHYRGESAVVHGSRPWFEMCQNLEPSNTTASPPIPPEVFDALRLPSVPKNMASFESLSLDAIKTDESANAFDLICPRPGCGSLILKKLVGQFRINKGIPLDPHPLPEPLLPLPELPDGIEWWLITPNPMQFENIAFSRPTNDSTANSGMRVKLLACAECELGPLGWCEESSSEFWLAARRVCYRQS